MPKNFHEELTVPLNPQLRSAYALFPEPPDGQLKFTFALQSKPVRYGGSTFDHIWMKTTSLYGQSGQTGTIGDALANYFWASCLCDAVFLSDDDVAGDGHETFALAKLASFARSNGARRVFADPRPRKVKPEELTELNEWLVASSQQETTPADFQRQTGDLLGPREYSADEMSAYHALCRDLFSERLPNLIHSPMDVIESLRARWNELMGQIGRRRGNQDTKLVLDVISYEARAAIHRCYSHAWVSLMDKWAAQGMDRRALAFHRLWHLEGMSAEDSQLPNNHLFHGHIFGLHPANSSFIRTPAGLTLISDYIEKAPETEECNRAFLRVLWGIQMAVYWYAIRRDELASHRKKQPKLMSGFDLDQIVDS